MRCSDMLYDDFHDPRVTARNTQDRTVEQMWDSSVPPFSRFQNSLYDSHRSQMSHHRHELTLQSTSYGCVDPTCAWFATKDRS